MVNIRKYLDETYVIYFRLHIIMGVVLEITSQWKTKRMEGDAMAPLIRVCLYYAMYNMWCYIMDAVTGLEKADDFNVGEDGVKRWM